MKRLALIAITSLLSVTNIAAAQSDASARVAREIQPMLDEMMNAANAHDTERYMKAFVRAPSTVFSFNGVELDGWEAIEAQQLKWWNYGKSDVVYTLHGTPRIEALSPESAVVTMALESRRTLPTGQPAVGGAIVTMAVRKLPEGWRIVQGHESTPH